MADSRRPGNDIYTALIFFALLALLFGVGYVWYRSSSVFTSSPWEVGAQSQGQVAPLVVEHLV